MNFTLLLATMSSFSITFDASETNDLLHLNGPNVSAQLLKVDKDIFLHLTQRGNRSSYSTSLNKEIFNFTWDGFLVDGQPMLPTKPLLHSQYPTTFSTLNHEAQCLTVEKYGTNYWYICGFAVFAGFLYKSFSLFIQKYLSQPQYADLTKAIVELINSTNIETTLQEEFV